MKRVVRRGVFETNSSSAHSLTICTQDEWNKWKEGELVWDRWSEGLINKDAKSSLVYTYDEFWDYESFGGDEKFHEEYTTPSGEVIHAFGYYGYN